MYFLKIKLNQDNCVFSAFKVVYGIGSYKSKKIVAFLGVRNCVKVKEIAQEQLNKLEKFFEDDLMNLEMELYRKEYYNVKRLIDVNCYRGFCHKNGLPVWGQRTHTNAKTQKALYKTRLELRKIQ